MDIWTSAGVLAGRGSHRLRRAGVMAAAAVLAVLAGPVVAACGGGSGSPGPSSARTDRPGAPQSAPTARPSAATDPAAAPADGRSRVRTSVYFLHGGKVSPAPRTVTAPTTAAGAVRALLAGPAPSERRHGRTTAIPSGTALRSVVVRAGVATVDLSGRYDDDGGGSRSLRARLAQVVFTATAFPAVHEVRFALDGRPVTSFGAEGVVLDHPVGRADFEDVAPLVLVESPLIGDGVRGPVRVRGSANTFEAAFRLRITDAGGRTLADVPVTASSGTGTRGTFDVTVPCRAPAAPGEGTLTAYWNSPQDGHPVVEDTVPLAVDRP